MKKIFIKYQTFITYLASALSSFGIDILFFYIFNLVLKNNFKSSILISSYLARLISSIYNYLINKNIVFKDKEDDKSYIGYFILVIINITISGLLVTKIYSILNKYITFIKIAIDILIFVTNYFIQKLIVFKK